MTKGVSISGHLLQNITTMGRGRIKVKFRDNIAPGGPRPDKSAPFAASSIPNADASVFRELKAAVSKVESRVGIDLPQSNLGFTDSGEFLGVHFGAGNERTVLLNRAFFNRSSQQIIADLQREISRKWSVDSTALLQYITIHELGHSIWVDRIEGNNPRLSVLNSAIRALYTSFNKEVNRGRIPISKYAETNINEFVAETFVKGIIGKKQNRYSKKLLQLFREHRDLLTRIR